MITAHGQDHFLGVGGYMLWSLNPVSEHNFTVLQSNCLALSMLDTAQRKTLAHPNLTVKANGHFLLNIQVL